MLRRSVLLVLIGAAALFPTRVTSEVQESPSTLFRIQVEMVLLNVAVTDGKGNYITGLRPSDFEVYEDGIAQQLATFAEGNEIPQKVEGSGYRAQATARSDPAPSFGPQPQSLMRDESPEHQETPTAGSNVLILFDTSNSMYRGFVYAQDAIAEFVRLLDSPERVGVYAFSRDVKRIAPVSADREEVLRAVRHTVAGDDIALYNALLVTLRDSAQLPGRKMLVVFSNGPDNASMVAPENVRELAQAEGIPIYMISTQEAKQDPISAAVFERMSASTGGKAYFAKNWKDQQKTFVSIRDDLAHLYSLSYYPQPNPNSGYRRITVKLVGERLKKCHTRTRVGYRPKPVRISETQASPFPFR